MRSDGSEIMLLCGEGLSGRVMIIRSKAAEIRQSDASDMGRDSFSFGNIHDTSTVPK